jgi:hypothetical protein
MKFIPVDWTVYNEPPFFPQWLSRGETKILAEYDDGLLAELDTLCNKFSDQYDPEKAKAVLLDRIGKIVGEQRDGNNDSVYLILILLRILLNTTNGGVNDIIKTIKFLYSSEVVHIVPDYPAGLIIEHDGEGTPGLNFNKILAEIVPAGVNFSTKELFNFFEEILPSDDLPDLRVVRNDTDRFGIQVKYDGSIKYDGHTINDTVWIYSNYDGLHKYDGTSKYNGVRKTACEYPVRTAFKYSSRTADVQTLAVQLNASEAVALSEAMWFLLKVVHEDTVDIAEAADTAVKIRGFQDTIDTAETVSAAVRVGYHEAVDIAEKVNTAIRLSVLDTAALSEAMWFLLKVVHEDTVDITEAASTTVKINGFQDTINTAETFALGMCYHRNFDGQYQYDGTIKYNSTALQPLEL